MATRFRACLILSSCKCYLEQSLTEFLLQQAQRSSERDAQNRDENPSFAGQDIGVLDTHGMRTAKWTGKAYTPCSHAPAASHTASKQFGQAMLSPRVKGVVG
jgi:hypothetical protein